MDNQQQQQPSPSMLPPPPAPNSRGIAYVAGPYRALDPDITLIHIANARMVATALWNIGYTVVCPHLNCGGLEHDVDTESVLLPGLLQIMRRCDLVVLAPHWEHSPGTLCEAWEAMKHAMQVVVWDWQCGGDHHGDVRYPGWREIEVIRKQQVVQEQRQWRIANGSYQHRNV